MMFILLFSNYFTSLSMQIHTVKVPSNNFNQSPSLKFIMTFQRLLILSIYCKKINKVDKCHWESGNFFVIKMPFVIILLI